MICLVSCIEKLDITDLDIAYMAIFEEGNNEYIKERETTDPERIPIPQRLYTSFLESVESDVMEYVGVASEVCRSQVTFVCIVNSSTNSRN